ncbi:MAG: glycosyltransferase family 39 protein [bacterium]
MPYQTAFTPRSLAFIAVHTLVWYVMILIAKPFLDKAGDMAEVWAWSQHLLMGTNKHPQLLPWATQFWFDVFPRTPAAFYGLAAVTLLVGLAGIYALGRQFLGSDTKALAALGLSVLAFPYLTLADKLNMNAICLATWPWAAWAFLWIVKHPTSRKGILAGAAFGLFAALAIQGKYYSALPLASILVASFTPRIRPLWRRLGPWTGVAVFALLTLPFLIWQIDHDFATFKYVDERGHGLAILQLLDFAFAPISFWLLPFSIVLTLFYRGPWLQRVKNCWRWTDAQDVLWYLTVGPYVVSLLFGVLGLVHLSVSWSIPIGYTFTILWVRNADPGSVEAASKKFIHWFRWIWPAMIALSLVYTVAEAFGGIRELYTPEAEAAAEIAAHWETMGQDGPISWAAANVNAARVAFYWRAPIMVEVLPGLPGQLPDYYPPRATWQSENGVVICPLGGGTDTEVVNKCTREATDWAAKNGVNLIPYRFSVHRSGLYFPRLVPYSYAAFYVIPA